MKSVVSICTVPHSNSQGAYVLLCVQEYVVKLTWNCDIWKHRGKLVLPTDKIVETVLSSCVVSLFHFVGSVIIEVCDS